VNESIVFHALGHQATSKSTAGGGMSTADVQDLTVTKWVDSATPNLLL